VSLRRRRAVGPADLLTTLAGTAARLRTADDSTDTRLLLCREAVTLAGGNGAVLYLAGPGRLLAVAGHGNHPRPPRGELEVDARVERAVRQGTVEADPELLVVPVLGESGVLGAVAIYGAGQPADAAGDALQVFAHLTGSVFERFGSVAEEGETDPVTGVGDHRRGAAALASVRPGDGVVVCELDGIRELRGRDPAAADLAQGQLGLRLRNAIRPGDAVARSGEEAFVLVLRQLRAPVDVVVRRILDHGSTPAARGTVSVGAALHIDAHAPADTAETASRMMLSAKSAGVGQLYVAPVGS
jgi:GGDEF domain-containing protein